LAKELLLSRLLSPVLEAWIAEKSMNYDQWTQSINRDVTAFNDSGPKVVNRLLEAYEDELNEEEELSILESGAKTKSRARSYYGFGK
jgi:hypothetical protein